MSVFDRAHTRLGSLLLGIVALLALTAAPAAARAPVQSPQLLTISAAWQGRDGFCDPWNTAKDPDCRDRRRAAREQQKQQKQAAPPPVDPATELDPAEPVDPLPEPLPIGDQVWPAPPGGRYAKLRSNGRTAVAPKSAPKAVKLMIRAANSLTSKPYIWGGGHTRWRDRGYDCSGAVSFVLRRSGHVFWPMVSGQLARWGANGPGRWVQIYAHKDHVFMVIAGLRFDTSPWGSGKAGPRWRTTVRTTRKFALRHPVRL